VSTLDQIEELRRGNAPGLTLQQAARKAGLPYQQCTECKGRGFTKATMLLSKKALDLMIRELPNDPPAIQYERCPRCGGAGGFTP
jgi:hypothetical protein